MFALSQKSEIEFIDNCGGALIVMYSEKVVELHLFVTVKLILYSPGLLKIKDGSISLAFEFKKFPGKEG